MTPHIFDPKNKERLDNPWRRRILDPKKILSATGVQAGHTVLDFGCGIGYFAIPAARIAGPKGRVYAADLSGEMLSQTRRRAISNNLSNILYLKSKGESLKISKGSLDFILVFFTLHEIPSKDKFLRMVRRLLKNHGRIAIIDWQKKKTRHGPPVTHRLSKKSAADLLTSAQFKSVTALPINPSFYFLTAETNRS